MPMARLSSKHVPAGHGPVLRTTWGETLPGKVTAEETGGAFTLAELVAPPGWIRPLYVHHGVDECFYVVEGTFDVLLDDRNEPVVAGPGSFVYVPRGVGRSLFNARGQVGRMLVIQTPGHPADGTQGEAIELIDGPHLRLLARTTAPAAPPVHDRSSS